MSKIILLLAISVLICGSASAQKKIEGHWGKNYLNVAYSAAATTDGGYIVVPQKVILGKTILKTNISML